MQDQENDPLSTNGKNTTVSDSEPVNEPPSSDTESASVPGTNERAMDSDEAVPAFKEESRSRRVFRKLIRWSVGLLIVFGLGFLTAIYTIYNPKLDEIDQLKTELDGASTTISDLEATISAQQDEIESLNAQISTLNQQITNLENEKQGLTENQNNSFLIIAL
ncbi:hypothetical protein ACFLXI_04760, partial [Chloroflexota bacterium]